MKFEHFTQLQSSFNSTSGKEGYVWYFFESHFWKAEYNYYNWSLAQDTRINKPLLTKYANKYSVVKSYHEHGYITQLKSIHISINA